MTTTEKPVALIIGAGDHLGSAIARRFAKEGFHLVVTRRRGDLDLLSSEIQALGSSATAIHSDARDEDQVIELVERVESEHGPIRVAVFNVGGNVRYDICETSTRVYRKVWEMCALAGFLVGREVAKKMLQRNEGTLLFTGASASLRETPPPPDRYRSQPLPPGRPPPPRTITGSRGGLALPRSSCARSSFSPSTSHVGSPARLAAISAGC